MDFCTKWIQSPEGMGTVCPVFKKEWKNTQKVKKAELVLTALGVYEATLNGKRVSDMF